MKSKSPNLKSLIPVLALLLAGAVATLSGCDKNAPSERIEANESIQDELPAPAGNELDNENADNESSEQAHAQIPSEPESVLYDLNLETYRTETLLRFDGCENSQLSGNFGQPRVYKDHVYVPILGHNRMVRILQVPLGEGEAKIHALNPDYQVNNDSHNYFELAFDGDGYVHLTGNMHGANWRYWRSEKLGDISSLVPAPEESSPKGKGITYPHFHTTTNGGLFLSARSTVPWGKHRGIHTGLMNAYDPDSRTWRALGADIPETFGGKPGFPVTVWEDDFEAINSTYARHSAKFVSGPGNTMHFLFVCLNMTPQKHAVTAHTVTDLLYATSRDGGKTIQKLDGSTVQWPVRAEAGPHQPDVVYAEPKDSPFPWLDTGGGNIQLDWKGRPIILATKRRGSVRMAFRLEDGKWVSCPDTAFGGWRDNAGVLTEQRKNAYDIIRIWDENNRRVVKLGQQIRRIDEDYLRDTGTMIYTTRGRRNNNSVINVMRTTITRPEKP